jgi:hypothetical protein
MLIESLNLGLFHLVDSSLPFSLQIRSDQFSSSGSPEADKSVCAAAGIVLK